MISAVTPIAIPAARADQLDARVARRLNAGSFSVFQLDATAYPGFDGGYCTEFCVPGANDCGPGAQCQSINFGLSEPVDICGARAGDDMRPRQIGLRLGLRVENVFGQDDRDRR